MLFSLFPPTVRAFNFYRGKSSTCFFLIESRRIIRTHAINNLFRQSLHFFPKYHHPR